MGEDNLENEVEEKLLPTTVSHKSVRQPQAKLWGFYPASPRGASMRPYSMKAACRKKKNFS